MDFCRFSLRCDFIFTFTCLIILSPVVLNAQEDFEKWLKKDKQAFNDFQTKQDKQFVEMLRTGWIKSEPEEIPPVVSRPKPRKPFFFNEQEVSAPGPALKKIEIKPPSKVEDIKEPAPKKEVKPDIPFQPPAKEEYSETVSFDFFGTTVSLMANPGSSVAVNYPLDSSSIAAYWEKLSKTDHKGYLSQLYQLKEKMRLNDWGYIQLTDRLAQKMKLSSNERTLFVWFVMSKSGYLCKVAYGDNRVFLVCSTHEPVFGTSFIRDASANGNKLYILLGDSKELVKLSEVYCYNGKFPGAVRSFELAVKEIPDLTSQEGTRPVNIRIQGNSYPFNFTFNKAVVDYFRDYPQTELGLYTRTALSANAEKSLIDPLKKLIGGKTKTEALNFILNFVQYATDYETDQQQFDREKPLFPEESLFYQRNDCEDRSILFSYLVRKLLNEKVVLLDYPDHIAAAVRTTDPVSGLYLEIGNEKYVICDPTYIGAGAGQCMPEYQNLKPGIISVN